MQIGPANAISTIARVGDTRHVLSLEPSAVDAVHVREWIATNGTWTEQGTYYTAAMFGLLVFDTNFDLSPDGLRIILQAVGPGDRMQQMYYLDRPSIDARFETAQRIDMLRVLDPFITEDCTQVYFSDLDRTFYVSRQ
jgi:hypothetical protein